MPKEALEERKASLDWAAVLNWISLSERNSDLIEKASQFYISRFLKRSTSQAFV